jgi:outer membrane protein
MSYNCKTLNAMKILLLLLCIPLSLSAQDTTRLNLQEVVRRARSQSVASLIAETGRESSYWEYRSYRASLYPQLALLGTLPDFNRSFSPAPQPDGSIRYQPIVINNSGLNLELRQNVGISGGELFLNSQMQRFDDLKEKKTQYNSNPISIGYRQSLFAYNPFRWAKKIEPLRLERSRRNYLSQLEGVSLEATTYYFALLLAQMDHRMALQNVANGKKILEIASVRHDMGRISQNSLLQVRYSLLNAKNALVQARQDVQTAFLQLKAYAGLEEGAANVEVPSALPSLQINKEKALAQALKNKETVLDFKIRSLEAQREVQIAKGERGPSAGLFASVGLSNAAEQLEGVYQDPVNQQRVSIGFTIPIVDWGRSKALVKTAEAQQKLTAYSVQQEQLIFEQQLITEVTQMASLEEQIAVAKEAAEVAQQRYRIAGESFGLGQISITELNIAQNEKDNARRIYLQVLRNFWETYYRLRLLTLYDFEQGEPIGEEK